MCAVLFAICAGQYLLFVIASLCCRTTECYASPHANAMFHRVFTVYARQSDVIVLAALVECKAFLSLT